MQMAEEFDTELIGFEQQLAQQMEHYAPDSIFVQDLKDRLGNLTGFQAETGNWCNPGRQFCAIVFRSYHLHPRSAPPPQ